MLPKIVKSPAPVLLRPTQKIENIDKSIRSLVRTMGLVLRTTNNAVALAANQIGYSKAVFVYVDQGKLYTVINPQIHYGRGSNIDNEGCLSIPGKLFRIDRPTELSVSYTDLEGERLERVVKDFAARMFCHEIEHLEGKLINEDGYSEYDSRSRK